MFEPLWSSILPVGTFNDTVRRNLQTSSPRNAMSHRLAETVPWESHTICIAWPNDRIARSNQRHFSRTEN
jgi:hypothetical protein